MFGDKLDRRINIARILRAIWLNREISRIKLAEILHLDKSTVSNIVSLLLKNKLIEQTSEGQAGPLGGRKPVPLTINQNFGVLLGIELQPDSYHAVVTTINGKILFSQSKQISLSGDNLVEYFIDIVTDIKRQLEENRQKIIGIGVGLSGIIHSAEGCIYQSIPLNITEKYDFISKVKDVVDIPIYMENDANCCCWGELAFGQHEELKNFIYVLGEFREGMSDKTSYLFGDFAVGVGIVINGKVYYGSDFSAGEFRSIFWKNQNKSQFSLTDNEIREAGHDYHLFEQVMRELAKNLALLVNTFNFSHLYLGGFIKDHDQEIISILNDEIQHNWPYYDSVKCRISFSALGYQVVAYGAAGMIVEKLFSLPEINENGKAIWTGNELFILNSLS
ncbi:MAG: ROK family transcriptional regulator [Spirochaetes bacterium]|nr:ROK family transcriptional regulator [Spirochaetota bacterium]